MFTKYDVLVYDVLVYDVLVYDVLVYDVLVYDVLVYDVLVYDVTILPHTLQILKIKCHIRKSGCEKIDKIVSRIIWISFLNRRKVC